MTNNLLRLVNSEAGRFLLGRLGQKPEFPVVKITESSFIEKLGKKTYRATFFSGNSIERLFSPIVEKMLIAHEEYKPIKNHYEAFLHYSDLERKNNKYPLIFLDTATFNPASGANSPVDGRAARNGVNQTFANIRAGAGVSANNTASSDGPYLFSTGTTDQYDTLIRFFTLFNTATLTADATISAAVISFYGSDKANGNGSPAFHVAAATPAANDSIAASDYGNVGSTSFGNVAYASYSTSAYNDITLDANGRANISKTGISKFSEQLSWDILNDTTGLVWAGGAESYTLFNTADAVSNNPKLVVTYTLPTVTGFFHMSV